MTTLSTAVVWGTFAIIFVIVLAALVTWVILLAWNTRSDNTAPFSCQTPNSAPAPSCPHVNITSGVPAPAGGFLTSQQIKPSFIPTQSMTPTPPLTGYYHSHPTAYYVVSPGGTLYSYPFILQVTGSPMTVPTLQVAPYAYSPQPTEVAPNPPQFAYGTSLGQFDGYTFSIPAVLSTMSAFTPDFAAYPNTGGPTLTSVLSSTGGGRTVSIISNQGSPYIALRFTQSSFSGMMQALSMNNVLSYSQQNFVVTSPPARNYTAYILWNSSGSAPRRNMVWFCDTTITQSFSVTSEVATLSIGLPGSGNLDAIIYVSFFADIGPFMLQSMQSIANSLIPCWIPLTDILPGSNVTLQYSVMPMNGQTLIAGSSTLWIVPPTSFEVAGLSAVNLETGYLDFPTGNGIFQTQLQVGSTTNTNFYTIWPPPAPIVGDFNYSIPNTNVTDTNSTVASDLEMYDLATAIRVLTNSPGNSAPTDSQLNQCITTWNQKLQGIQVGNYTLFTNSLGPGDPGLLSRLGYLLLTFLHLNSVSGSISNTTSLNGLITSNNTQLTMLIEGGMTTAPLASQGTPTYNPVAFMDTYMGTFPVIRTVDNAALPGGNFPQLISRLGEVLGYLWACDWLVRGGFVQGPSTAIPFYARCLMSIALESTTRLIRAQCVASPLPNLSPVMPWSGILSKVEWGFAKDGYSPDGSSPDTVLLQSFVPFTPISNMLIRPLLTNLQIQVQKLLRCNQVIPQVAPARYNFNNFVDPFLVGYFCYLYFPQDLTGLLQFGQVPKSMSPFVKLITPSHPSVALLMNNIKQISIALRR